MVLHFQRNNCKNKNNYALKKIKEFTIKCSIQSKNKLNKFPKYFKKNLGILNIYINLSYLPSITKLIKAINPG